MAKLDGKVALISGAGRGVGRALALKLASEGAKVVVNDIDADPAAETVAAIQASGGQAVACAGDVTDLRFPQAFVDAQLTATDGGRLSDGSPCDRARRHLEIRKCYSPSSHLRTLAVTG